MKIKLQAGRLVLAVAIAAGTLLAALTAQAADSRAITSASNEPLLTEPDHASGPAPRAYRGIGPTPVNLLDFLNAAGAQPVPAAVLAQQVAAAPTGTRVSLAEIVAEAQWRKQATERLWRRVD